jgi:hypothetical protein
VHFLILFFRCNLQIVVETRLRSVSGLKKEDEEYWKGPQLPSHLLPSGLIKSFCFSLVDGFFLGNHVTNSGLLIGWMPQPAVGSARR